MMLVGVLGSQKILDPQRLRVVAQQAAVRKVGRGESLVEPATVQEGADLAASVNKIEATEYELGLRPVWAINMILDISPRAAPSLFYTSLH